MKKTTAFKTLLCSMTLLCLTTLLAQDNKLLQELKPFLHPHTWTQEDIPEINKDVLVKSLDAARKYYLAQQRKDGNFTYALDIASGETANDDNQVRQAGALWGLVTLHRDFPTDDTRQAIIRGLDFVSRNTRQLETGETVFAYPGDDTIKTGTIALLCLALADFYNEKNLDDNLRQHYRRMLFNFLAYLRTMELENGSWSRGYVLQIGFRDPDASPYYDGESLLAYAKCARLLNRKDLVKRINYALPKLSRKYTVDAWGMDGDDDLTKGFYQWGSMACEQYVEANWTPHRQLAVDTAIALSWWQIYNNQVESKRGNTAYALEGLTATLHIAQMTNNKEVQKILVPILKRIIARLTICQFHGPFMHLNPKFLLLENPSMAAIGGVTDNKNGTVVRIDIVQHQVHAILLLLKYLPL